MGKRTVDSVAAAHVAELRARTEAFYVGALSFESFGVKQREHWDREHVIADQAVP